MTGDASTSDGRYLGLLAWYSIASEDGADEPLRVARDELASWFEELGLDQQFVPSQVRGVEAFRSATSNLTDEWVSNEIRYRVEVREVKRTEQLVTRQLFAVWNDPEHGRQERRVADLQFFRPHRVTAGRQHGTERFKTMLHQGLKDLDQNRLRALVQRAEALYRAHATRMTPHVMRNLVRAYLIYLGAVSLRSGGGAYFLQLDKLDELRALRQLVSRCGPECRLMFTPMVDDPEQRTMMRELIELNVVSRAQSLLREIDEWRRRNEGKTPGRLTRHSWRGETEALTELLVEYGDLLEEPFERAGTRIEELQDAMRRVDLLVAASGRAR